MLSPPPSATPAAMKLYSLLVAASFLATLSAALPAPTPTPTPTGVKIVPTSDTVIPGPTPTSDPTLMRR